MTHQPATNFSISIHFPFNRAGGRTSNVLPRNLKPQLDKKNDVNWCMQFIAPVLGCIFLFMGSKLTVDFWSNFKQYYLIYFGVFWIVIGLIHRMKWLHKQELQKAWNLKREWTDEEKEEAEQAVDGNPH